ncbi:MAG: translocation/assembly module TamB domain-containing protein [Polyangiaceae bacterium]
MPGADATRRRSWLVRGLTALVFTLVYVLFAVAGLILHLDVPVLRGLIGDALNGALATTFRGQIRFTALESVSPSSVVLSGVTVRETATGPLLGEVERLRVGIEPQALLLDVLFGDADSALTISHVRAERAKVWLLFDEHDAEPSLVRAFAPVRSGAPSSGPSKTRGLDLPVIELGRGEIVFESPALGHVEGIVRRVHGRVSVGSDKTTIVVDRFGLRLREPARLRSVGTGSLVAELPGRVSGKFHGLLREVELDVAGGLDGHRLDLNVSVPSARPEQVRNLLPEWPLTAPLRASVRAQGELPELTLDGTLSAGSTVVGTRGTLSFATPLGARLGIDAQDIDLGLFAAGAPRTAIDLEGTLALSSPPEGFRLDFEANSEATAIGGEPLPRTNLAGRYDGKRLDAELRFKEDTADVSAHLLVPHDGAIELDARVRDLALGSWSRYPGLPPARVDLDAKARLDEGRLRADVSGRVDAGVLGPVRLRTAQLSAHAEGLLAEWRALQVDASLAAEGLELGPLAYERARLEARARRGQAHFELRLGDGNGPHGTLRGDADLRAEPVLRDVDVSLDHGEMHLDARIAHAEPVRGTLELEHVRLAGAAGELEGRLRLGPDLLEGHLDARAFDLGWAARMLGRPALVSQGKLTGELELVAGKDVTRGEARFGLVGFMNPTLSLGSARVRATLDEQAVEGDLQAIDPALGNLGGRFQGQIAGSALAASAWLRATGEAELNVNRVPLMPLRFFLPEQAKIDSLGGYTQASLKLTRKQADELPDIALQIGTEDLRLSLAGPTPLSYEQLVLKGSTSVNGQSGQTSLVLVLGDVHGDLLTASATLVLDLRELAREPALLGDKLLAQPLDALLKLHPRSLGWLPPPLELPGISGEVEASLTLSGVLGRPKLVLVARGKQLTVLGAEQQSVDVSASASYASDTGHLDGNAEVVHASQRVLNARVEADLPERFRSVHGQGARSASLRAAALLNGLPLELVPELASRKLSGRIHGSAQLEQHGDEVRQEALFELLNLAVQDRSLGSGRLTASANRETAQATLRLGTGARFLRAELRGTTDRDAPWWSPAWGAFEGTASARNFDAVAILPALPGIVTRVAGDVDVQATVRLQRNADSSWHLGVQGDASLVHGSAHIEPLGLEVRELSASARAEDTGGNTLIHVESIQAKARSSQINLRGELDLRMKGVQVIDGNAALQLRDVPLTLQGLRRGTATGDVDARLLRMPDHMLVIVDLPRLRVQLPSSSSQSLIELDEPSDVIVLQNAQPSTDDDGESTLWKIQINFSNNVRLARSDLDLPVRGQILLDFKRTVRPSGQVDAGAGGRITLFDRVFVIERGTLQFVPDEPGNPRIDLSASWLAPDGTTIYVDVTGTAKQASIKTRDDAGLDEPQRFELLAGASSTDDTREPTDSRGTAAAIAIGQTFASLGINELLRNSLGDVSLRVGTASDNRTTYTASVRLSNKLWLEGNFSPGTGQSNASADTQSQAFTGTLDYRLSQSWSLRTELGTAGGAFDLLWSHRY